MYIYLVGKIQWDISPRTGSVSVQEESGVSKLNQQCMDVAQF
jgi:hypothetical protein